MKKTNRENKKTEVRKGEKEIKNRQQGEIAWQNKDITSKILAEGLKEKSFSVYGIHSSRIIEVLPTNLPAIEANELRMDNLFLLEDGSYALVDYESQYLNEDKIKYLNYLARTLRRLNTAGIRKPKVRMIVLYTSNVMHAETVWDIGCLRMTIEPGYLAKIDGNRILKLLEQKNQKHAVLESDELMLLIILPLTCRDADSQKEMLRRCIEIARKLPDEHQQVFALSGIVTFSDKIIEPETADDVRRWIQMTKVGRLFEIEKEEAVKEAVEKIEKEKIQPLKKESSILRQLLKGRSVSEVAEEFRVSRQEIEELVRG